MEAFLATPSASHASAPLTGAPLRSAKQLPPQENPNAAVVVGSWAAVGAAVAVTRRGRGRCARRAEESAAFDVWNPSTYGNITMDDVKKYGAAGTLSYVITELIFWAVAFPTEVFLYLQTAGHWPDFSKPEESAAVFGMVFAASNVARLLLPLRFGAALAMAPWVDENIMQRFSGEQQEARLAAAANAAADLRVEAARAQLGSAAPSDPAISRAAERRVQDAMRELEARPPRSPSPVSSASTSGSLKEFLMEVR